MVGLHDKIMFNFSRGCGCADTPGSNVWEFTLQFSFPYLVVSVFKNAQPSWWTCDSIC